jgi:hypothetical protein
MREMWNKTWLLRTKARWLEQWFEETEAKLKQLGDAYKKTKAAGECHRGEESTNPGRKRRASRLGSPGPPGKMSSALLLLYIVRFATTLPTSI